MMAHEERTAKEWIEPLGKGSFIFCVTARLYEYACCFSIFKTKEFRVLERLSGAGCLLGKPPKAIGDVIWPPLRLQSATGTLFSVWSPACSACFRVQSGLDCNPKQAELECNTA